MMATGENTTTPSGAEECPRCLEKNPIGHPCWRPAVERRYSNDEEPTICAEHLRAYELAIEEGELLNQLNQFGAWIATWDDPTEGETPLQYFTFTARQKMVEELWSLSIRAKAAELIAAQGPEEKPLTPEEAERLADYELRSRALFHAAQALQDLQAVPEEAFGGEFNRWHTAGALLKLEDAANVEQVHYVRELGLRP